MGIGKHYGLELAKKGFNIVMIDKDENETEKTRRELVQSGVKVIKDINFFLKFHSHGNMPKNVQVNTIIWDLGDLGDAERYEGFEKVLTETTKGKFIYMYINSN